MGSSGSRLGSRPPRTPRAHRIKRALSSFFFCAGSSSLPPLQMVDDPAELLVISAEHSDLVVNNSPSKDSAVTSTTGTEFSPQSESGASSRCSKTASESSSEDGLDEVETRNREKGPSRSKELVPTHQLNADYRYGDSASTSYGNQLSSDPVSASERANINVLSRVGNRMNRDKSQICSEVASPGCSSFREFGNSHSDRTHVENYVGGVETTNNSDLNRLPGSSVTLHSLGNGPPWDAEPSGPRFAGSDRERGNRGENVLHLDVVSISSSILSSSTAELSGSREARRNSRRQFWDAFSRRSSRRHSNFRTSRFPTDDIDDQGSQDRWLLDFGGDFFEDRVEGDSGYLGRRTHGMSQRRLRTRTEFWDRLRGGLDTRDGRTSICPSGLHLDGSCSCESILMPEEPSTRSSISRIVMLAEALFEVLDEIHQQPVPLSLSVVSLPAPESIVDSFPVKNYGKEEASENGEGVEQCYICLAEYEEADKIRSLPCQHEFHMSCIDKWLKEIHGVCPLCRRDVREGFEEGSFSNSGTPSL